MKAIKITTILTAAICLASCSLDEAPEASADKNAIWRLIPIRSIICCHR